MAPLRIPQENGEWLNIDDEIERVAGGSGALMVVTATLDDAEIKALTTNAGVVTLVAATETIAYSGSPTSLPIPVSAVWRTDFTGGAYTGETPHLMIGWGNFGSGSVPDVQVIDFGAGGTLESATEELRVGTLPFGAAAANLTPASLSPLGGGINDNGLYLNVTSGSTDPMTGGDPANFATMTVSYFVADLAPPA